ncbi:MAG TPA: DUF1338 domain-containing protein [Bacteroidales bacterium]|nr:DUF1338 domain-containing protein [Bacteroidales bacterium]HRZ48304.1 DUF1338 domain-containing protein [Bacteroidales bacterium]
MRSYREIISRLWDDYTRQNRDVKRVYDLFLKEEGKVMNDHIALRTFDDPRVNIEVLARPFLACGYHKADTYFFEDKRLNAAHFEHPDFPEAPLVFISELRTGDFSQSFQGTIQGILNKIDPLRLESDDLIFDTEIFGLPSKQVYQRLLDESEYAGWLYINGFRANHFTVFINGNKKLDTLEKANQFLKDHGFQINSAGGEIKGKPEELLEQSSIMAGRIGVHFLEGVEEVPGCYYEFARRYHDQNGDLFTGFIAKSADKIFQSTDTR